MTDFVALFALAVAALALRVGSGGVLSPAPVPVEIVPGDVIKAGSPGV